LSQKRHLTFNDGHGLD